VFNLTTLGNDILLQGKGASREARFRSRWQCKNQPRRWVTWCAKPTKSLRARRAVRS